MKLTPTVPCKFCGEADDLRCSCVDYLPELKDLPPQVATLMPALQAGYYVIDGRDPTPDSRPPTPD